MNMSCLSIHSTLSFGGHLKITPSHCVCLIGEEGGGGGSCPSNPSIHCHYTLSTYTSVNTQYLFGAPEIKTPTLYALFLTTHLQDVQTYVSMGVHIGVVAGSSEFHHGGYIRVPAGKLE